MPKEQTKIEAKMNSLQNIHTWEMVSARQAELIKEAQNEHLAKLAAKPKAAWLKKLFSRQAQTTTIALNPNATPELS
jgi:hypothetical protein